MAKPVLQPKPAPVAVPATPLAKPGAPQRAFTMEETRRGWQLVEMTVEGDKVTARKPLDAPNLRRVVIDKLNQILVRL